MPDTEFALSSPVQGSAVGRIKQMTLEESHTENKPSFNDHVILKEESEPKRIPGGQAELLRCSAGLERRKGRTVCLPSHAVF